MNHQSKPLRIGLFLAVFLFCAIGAARAQNLFPNFQTPIKYPAITPCGSYMVFVAEDGTTAEAWESHFKDGRWSEPQRFDYINRLKEKTGHEIGGFNFNHDASMLLFHANMTGNYDVFYARKTKGEWGEPVSFGAPVNSGDDEFSPTISADMKTLFVLRNTPNRRNETCKELLMFEIDRDGKWAGPAYLSKEFNLGCQETPFFAADNATLYFSSMREDVNKSGRKTDSKIFNIYHAKRMSENVWMLPSFVDEINTSNNNLSPIVTASGDYFVSNVKAPRLRNQPQNIVRQELPMAQRPGHTQTISGAITDFYTKQPMVADIIVYDAITSVEKGRFRSTDDGRYSIILTHGDSYKLDFTKEGYSHTYFFKDVSATGKSGRDEFNTSLYNAIYLELNIYDDELFYPLTPKVSVTDSITGRTVLADVKPVSDGKYKAQLNIGNIYRIRVEGDNFDPHNIYFDLRTPVFYSDFEKSVELKSSKKVVVMNIVDQDGKSALPVTFAARNLNRNEEITELKDEGNGRHTVALRIGDMYEIDVTKVGYTYYNRPFSAATAETETVNVRLELLTEKARMVFDNITFETNSAELNAASYQELGRIVRLMNDNPTLNLEIAAHTDDVGADAFNLLLSNRRAQSVVQYLVSQGVAASSLRSRGYGKSQPMVPNTSNENRAKNRRVEIRIIE